MATVAKLKRPYEFKPIQVEKGIPVPPEGHGSAKYPWGDMDVGDSFFVPNIKPSALSNAATSYRYKSPKGKGKKFRTRTVEGGARVWRIA